MSLFTPSIAGYERAIQAIEEAFGQKWLDAKSRQRTHPHPIPKAWAETKAVLDESARTGQLRNTPAMVALLRLAADLARIRTLPNYPQAIPQEKLKGAEFEKYEYIARVTALAVEAGHRVAFILESRVEKERAADLKLLFKGQEVFVECKRKDSYQPKNKDDGVDELLKQLEALHPDASGNYEIDVLVAGRLERKVLDPIVRFIERLMKDNSYGVHIDGASGCVVSLQPVQSPPSPEGVIEVYFPAAKTPGQITAIIHVDEQGLPHKVQERRLSLYVVDSHALSNVVDSFSNARGQIPDDARGIIYIDLDVTHVERVDLGTYLDLVAAAMEWKLTPTANTRVGAIVLTIKQLLVDTTQDGKQTINLQQVLRIVRNLHHPLPPSFIIPGAHLPRVLQL